MLPRTWTRSALSILIAATLVATSSIGNTAPADRTGGWFDKVDRANAIVMNTISVGAAAMGAYFGGVATLGGPRAGTAVTLAAMSFVMAAGARGMARLVGPSTSQGPGLRATARSFGARIDRLSGGRLSGALKRVAPRPGRRAR